MVDTSIESEDGRKQLLRQLLELRRFEERVEQLFADNELPGFVHLYIGEEAVAVGATGPLTDADYITSTHRGHGHCVAMGLDPTYMFAELRGSRDGFCNGKGGSMHIADVDAGMLGANGIVGAGAPIATGAGLAMQVKDHDGVGLAFFGDGGISQGQVHESITLAAAWDLPVIYVVEKNQYVEMMKDEDVFGNPEFSDFGQGYGIPAEGVDGMDVEAVYGAVAEARERALAGQGPTLVVAETYRFHEHAEGTPHPRPADEMHHWRDRDPIESYRDRLVKRGELTEAEFERLDEEVTAAIDQAWEAAKDCELPDPAEAYDDVFVESAPDIEYHRRHLRGD